SVLRTPSSRLHPRTASAPRAERRLAREWDRPPLAIDRRRWDGEVPGAGAGNPPPVVVDEHMAVPAQEDAVGDIRSAAIRRPLIEVMCLGVRRWPVAARHSAPTVTDGERDALLRREESLFAADVERASRLIEGDRDDSTDAPLAVDEFTGDRL